MGVSVWGFWVSDLPRIGILPHNLIMGFSEAESSCAHRCNRGRATCVLCMEAIESPQQLHGAQERQRFAHKLRQQSQRNKTQYGPTAHAVVTR